ESVRVVACDVSRREDVAGLLASIARGHPLSAGIHTAAVLDYGVLEAQSEERLARGFGAKAAGAWELHELTREQDLEAVVMFSSVAGVLGGAAQSNYAAANTFLDALAQHRRAHGLPGTSVAWGYWAERSGLTAHLGEADIDRMKRGGLKALSSTEGLQLLDA